MLDEFRLPSLVHFFRQSLSERSLRSECPNRLSTSHLHVLRSLLVARRLLRPFQQPNGRCDLGPVGNQSPQLHQARLSQNCSLRNSALHLVCGLQRFGLQSPIRALDSPSRCPRSGPGQLQNRCDQLDESRTASHPRSRPMAQWFICQIDSRS